METFTVHDPQRLSHAYILSSPDRDACLNLAGRIAAAAVCRRGYDAPCGQCRDCRKAMAGLHPDIVHIRRQTDSKGQPTGVLTVDQIRAMTADAYILPNEAARKVYIVDEADVMKTPEAQNAALKTLEEPPAGVVFLLCVQNPNLLLPTVRSRCVELNANSEAQPPDPESMKLAGEYLRCAAAGDEAELCRWCLRHDRLDRSATAAFLNSLDALLADRLCGRETVPGLERNRLWSLKRLTERCAAWQKANVGTRHIMGLLAVEGLARSGNRGDTIA